MVAIQKKCLFMAVTFGAKIHYFSEISYLCTLIIKDMSSQEVLIGKIERFVRKFYLNRLIQGALIGAALWILFYLVVNTLEYFSWFSPKVRMVLFVLLLLGTAVVLSLYFIVPLVNLIRYRHKMSLEQAALLIGRFFPGVDDKLLNTLQLSSSTDTPSSQQLLEATIEQRTAQLAPLRFTDAVDLKGNLRYVYVFLILLLLLVLLFVFLPKFAVQPTQRIINYKQAYEKPLPFSVTLQQEALETRQGADIPFSIHVEGSQIPDAFYVKSSMGQQLFTKLSVNDYTHVFKNLYHDFSFQVIGGDYVSPPILVTVHPNPTLLSYQCKASYPAYIHRRDETFEGKTRLIVPQGTRLEFVFQTRDCDTLFVVRDSLSSPFVAEHDQVVIPYVAASSFQFDLVCRNPWSEHFDPIRFTVDIIPDAYPDIRVESFDEELSTQVYFSGLIADDYGFSKLQFQCDIKQPVERQVLQSVSFDKSLHRTSFFYQIDLDSLGVLPGQEVEVFFEVWDNDGFHGPKSKRSEVFSYYKPSMAALDSLATQTENDIIERMSNKSDEALNLRDDIEKMLQELTAKKDLDWTDKEKIQDLLEKQKAMEEEWNRLQEEQENLSDFMRNHELANEELLKKQQQINDLFEKVIPDELQKLMEEIDKLLEQTSRNQMQEILQNLKQDNKKLQDLLDRNLSLLEQLKMEKDINEFIEDLQELGEELASGQDTLSQDEAKEAFEDLMQTLDSLVDRNQKLDEPFNLQEDEALEESIEQDLNNGSKRDAGKKMQEMAQSMMTILSMGGEEQLAEDAHLVRILLENVVRASHQQEALMKELGAINKDDPSLSSKIVQQKELSSNFEMIEDSLRAMGLRQPSIQNFVFDELATIDRHTENALKQMGELKFSRAVSFQQSALMSMNNLALMLAESLRDMENMMSSSSCKTGSQKPKPGKQGSQSMQQLKDLQEKLGQQLKKLQQQMQQQNGQPLPSQSEEFARMAAEQEMLRQSMQQMLDEMKKNGQLGDDGLNQIIRDMERLEEDLVNKRVTKQTIERNRQILSRMLESQKAQEKRDQEEKRKSNEYRGSNFDRQVDDVFYKEQLKKNQEFLRQNPIQYHPYYKTKINEYYLKKNQH